MNKAIIPLTCGFLATAVTASAQGAGSPVQVTNDESTPVPTVVTNSIDAVPPADSAIFNKTLDSVPLAQSLITDVSFGQLQANVSERLILDYVSVETYVAPNQKAWAVVLPCTEKGNQGRTSIPLSFGGSVYNGDSKVNDAYLANIAMHTYVDSGCTTVVRVFRGGTAGLGHVNVTLQGHRVPKTLPIVIGGGGTRL